jgi:hypothetical protein
MDALAGGRNDLLEVDERGAVWWRGGGDCAAVEVGRTTEGLKLDFELDCGLHCRRCTPNAVREPRQLMCRFCCTDQELKRAKRDRPSAFERTAFRLFAALHPAREWRWQVCPPFASGRPKPFDFLHAPTATYIEVDGRHHFYGGIHNVPTAEQQRVDVEMMAAVWRLGAALVRLHYHDLAGAAGAADATVRAALDRRGRRGGPLLVLSPCYNPGPAVARGRVLDPWCFIAELSGLLGGARRHIDDAGRVWFVPDDGDDGAAPAAA